MNIRKATVIVPLMAGALMLPAGVTAVSAAPTQTASEAVTQATLAPSSTSFKQDKQDWRKGYRAGYRDGWNEAKDDCKEDNYRTYSDSGNEDYAKGYNAGFPKGFEAGFDEYCEDAG